MPTNHNRKAVLIELEVNDRDRAVSELCVTCLQREAWQKFSIPLLFHQAKKIIPVVTVINIK